jgi:hypothetical protein
MDGVEVDTLQALALRRQFPDRHPSSKTVLVTTENGKVLLDHYKPAFTLFYSCPMDLFASFPDPDGPTRLAVSEIARSCVVPLRHPGCFGSSPSNVIGESLYVVVFAQSELAASRAVLETALRATKTNKASLTAGLFVSTRELPDLCPLAGEIAADLRDVVGSANLYGTIVLSHPN